jgi:hypothetical protein
MLPILVIAIIYPINALISASSNPKSFSFCLPDAFLSIASCFSCSISASTIGICACISATGIGVVPSCQTIVLISSSVTLICACGFIFNIVSIILFLFLILSL